MGITVPDLVMPATGVCLAQAYVAISRNSLVLNPQGNDVYLVFTNYNVWNSYADRLAGRASVDTRMMQFQWDATGNDAVTAAYAAAYQEIKAAFPTYVDEEVALPDPGEPPAAP